MNQAYDMKHVENKIEELKNTMVQTQKQLEKLCCIKDGKKEEWYGTSI